MIPNGMFRPCQAALTLWLLLICSHVNAQQQTQYDKGTPPQHAVGVSSLGSYISTELGTINLSNGSLNFKIPLGTTGGRGMSLPLTLNYSSKVWSASIDTDFERESMTQQPVAYADYDRGLTEGSSLQTIIGAGWTIGGLPSIDAKRVLIGRIPGGPNVGCYNYELIKLTLYLPDRGEIELRDDATDGAPLSATCPNSFAVASRGTRWHATDGSGTVFINDVDNGVAQWPAPNLAGVVITADGTRIRFGENGSITDRNGNKITGYTDPLGRTVTVQHNIPDPENPSVMLRVLVTLPGYGGSRYYKIKTGLMNQNYRSGINPTLPVITGDWDPEGWGYNWWGTPTKLFFKSYGLYAQRIDDVEVLTELVLPDGRSLRFKYNQFGEVAEVQLPTGGKIQYDYSYSADLPTGSSPIWETGTNGSGNGIASDAKFVDRTVRERRTYPDGATLEGKWNYGYENTSASVSVRSSSDTLLSDTIHYFLPSGRYTEYAFDPGNHDGSHYTLWSTGVESRAETRDASGVVIAASEQDWTQRAPVAWPIYIQEQPANDNRVNQSRKFLDTGAMAKVETFYDQFNNPTEVKEYDFDQSLKRRTVTSYSSTNLVNGINYADDLIRLIRLPLQQSIYDSDGVDQARTIYEYDIYSADGNHDTLLSYPSITGHDTANYGTNRTTRGNVTRIANWIKTTDSYIYTYPRYDIAGNVVATKDPRGNVSTISFTDDFGNGANPGGGAQGTFGATHAYPTLITSPPPNPGETVHTARSQYDFSTGLLTGFKDRNSVITQTLYNDPFNRPTLVKSALGISGVETHAAMFYAPVTTPFGITLTNNDVLTARDQTTADDAALRSWTRTDGFGRTVEAWSKDPQGDAKVHTIHDALSRTKQVSNPYRPALGETAIYTTTAYDLAGRVVTVMTPDSAVVSTYYNGNQVLVKDQAGKERMSQTNALGQLIDVWEITPADDATEAITFPNRAEVTAGYRTKYEYDTLGSLITVTQQKGTTGTIQTRTFVYDSLKRLTSATNPESGTVGYQYDNNGNLLVKTDSRGVVSTYTHDALNRNTQIDYSDSTPDVYRQYDQAVNGKGRLNQIWQAGSTTSKTNIDEYDALGRPLVQRQRFETNSVWSASYQTSVSYNLVGAATSMIYPSGRTVTNAFDSAGRLQSFTGNLGDGGAPRTYANEFQYTAWNGLQQEKFGTTTPIYHKQRYNSRGQLWDMRASTVSFNTDPANGDRGAIVNYYSNSFVQGGSGTDNNGNLLRQENYIPGSNFFQDNFAYDSLNRLTSITEKLNGTGADSFKQAYIYDRWGNRTIDQLNTANAPKPNFGVDTNTNRLTAPPSYSMSFDAAGNLTFDNSDGLGGTRTYDAENRMTGAQASSPASYVYDADGHRVRRIIGTTETWQVYGLGGELVAEYAANAGPSNPQKEYGHRNSELLITAEIASAGPSPQNVSWTNAVGVSVSGNTITKTAGDGWGNAGAVSTQAIASGDGYVEFTAAQTLVDRICGLSNGDSNQSYDDIDFAILLSDGGYIYVYETGVLKANAGPYAASDILRVAVETGQVKYYKNGTLFYTSTATPSYPLIVDTAIYSNGASISNVMISGVSAMNVALATNGATASASSTYGTQAATRALDSDRQGAGYNCWTDDTSYGYPDWIQVDFSGSKTISEIDVFGLQQNYSNPVEPTLTMTSSYALTDFEVQYWDGSAWATVPGGSVSGNDRVWKKFTFAPLTTSKVRVHITNVAGDNHSQVVEVEAWTVAGGGAINVSWQNVVGATASGNSLTKTAGAAWGNAGASSTQTITSGDGYVEFTAAQLAVDRICGLSVGDGNQSHEDIDFGILMTDGGGVYAWESGVMKASAGAYATSDRLRVAVENGQVKYYKNGTLFYTSSATPSYPLLVDTALYSNGSTISNVVISGVAGGGGSSANVKWLVTDHLGTPRMVFDQTGDLTVLDQNGNYVRGVTRHDYLPFGEELFATTGGRSTAQGYPTTPYSSDNVRQKFTQKERDNETGLDYFLARYYSSTQGRFTSPDEFKGGPDELFEDVDPHDPLFYSDIADPQSLNKYQYCLNNPLRYIDPDGHQTTTSDRLKQAAATTADFGGGVVRGVVSSFTFGLIGAPEPTDSRVNRAGQVVGSVIEGVAGLVVAGPVTGGMTVGSGGTAVLTGAPAATFVAGGTMTIGSGVNLVRIGTTPIQRNSTSQRNDSSRTGSGAKSASEYDKHAQGVQKGKQEVGQLKDQLSKTKGPKRQAPIRERIQRLEKDIRGHEKEMRQKWPKGRPEEQ